MTQGDNGSNRLPHNEFRPHRGCTEAGIQAREAETKEIKPMTKDTKLDFKKTEINYHMTLPEPCFPMVQTVCIQA